MTQILLTLLQNQLAVCRMESDAPVPAWALTGSIWSITRTHDELSLVCGQERVPAGIQSEPGWRALKVEGPLDFALIGILAGLASTLAQSAISLFAISTYDTDYILIKADRVEQAIQSLQSAGYLVRKEAD